MTTNAEPNLDLTTSQRHLLWCIVCMAAALGLWLRLEWPDRKSHWEDECWTIQRTDDPSLIRVIEKLRNSPFPPLHYVMVWCFRQITGDSSVSTVRLVSIVMGVSAIPLTYLVWRRLLSPTATLWATAFVALNSFHILYSRDAKMYASVWLLAMISCGSYLVCSRPGARSRDYLSLGAANGLLILTSYVGLVALMIEALHGLGVWLRVPTRRRALLQSLLAVLIGLIPFMLWLPFAFQAVTQQTGVKWIRPVVAGDVLFDLLRLIGLWITGIWMAKLQVYSSWGAVLFLMIPFTALMTPAAVVAFLVEFIRSGAALRPASELQNDAKMRPPRCENAEVVLFLVMWLVLPLAGVIAFSFLVYPIWGVPRYLMAVAPAVVLLLSVCVASLRPRVLGIALGLLVLGVNLAAQSFDLQEKTRVPWNQVSDVIAQAAILDPGLASSVAEHQRVAVAFMGLEDLYFDHMSLKYALELRSENWQSDVYPLYELPKPFPRTALVVVIQCPNRPGELSREAMGWFLKNYGFLKVYEIQTYEEQWSRLPTPFERYTTEVWVCRPSAENAVDPVKPAIHAEESEP